jgi:hypothetical protein
MITFALCAVVLVPANSQLAPQAIEGDLALLRRAVREIHPGANRYRTPEQEAVAFQRLQGRMKRVPSRAEAYVAISEYLAGIKCGHTFLNPYNQSDSVRAEFFLTPNKLPFHYLWVDGKLIVTVAMPGLDLHGGDEVTKINGQPVPKLREALLKLARADGGRDLSRLRQMSLTGEKWEEADAFWPLICPPLRGEFTLTLPRRTVKVPAVKAAERRAVLIGSDPSYDAQWSFAMRPDGKAIMRLGHFVTWQMKSDWKAWMRQCFAALRAHPQAELLIDLRGCQGGSNEPIQLLASLIMDRGFTPMAMETRTAYRRVPDDLRPHVRTWDDSVYDFSIRAQPRPGGGFRLLSPPEPTIGPFAEAWKGDVTVAIGEANTSGGFLIAWLLRQSGRVRLVGSETGGSRQGLNAGQMFFLTLPATGLVVDVPIYATFPLSPQPEQGIVPDVSLPVTQASIATGRDPVIDTFFGE